MRENKDKEPAVTPSSLAQQIPPSPPAIADPPLPTASQDKAERLELNVQQPTEPTESKRSTSTGRGRRSLNKKPSGELQAMLPKNERVHVWKRADDGQLAFANDYNSSELKGFGSIEAFLRKFVVPKYGYGEFHLYLQRDDGNPTPIGRVSLLAPAEQSAPEVTTLKELLEAQQKMADQAKNDGGSMFEGMAKMMGILKDLKSDDGKGGIDPVMLMMLMQMNSGQQAPRGPDPMLQLLAQKLDALEERTREPAMAPMPMPPPAPPIDPMASMAPILGGVLDTMAKLVEVSSRPVPQPPPRDTLAELATMKTLFDRGDSFGAKEVITLLPTLKELISPGTREPESFSSQLASLRDGVQSLRSVGAEMGMDGGGGGSFWEAAAQVLQSVLGQRDLGQQVTQAVRTEIRDKQLPPHATAESGDDEPTVQVPEGFGKFAERINDSEDIAEKIGATVMGLQYLSQDAGFRPYAVAIFTKVRENKKAKAIELLSAFFEGMVEIEVIDKDAAIAVIKGVNEHWVAIRAQMGMDKPAPKKKPIATPAPEPEPEPGQAAAPANGNGTTADQQTEHVELEDEEDEEDEVDETDYIDTSSDDHDERRTPVAN